jgi:serine/threonine protein kinase
MKVHDQNGQPLELITLGKSGGEGSIYQVLGKNECAKIYHKPTGELHQKTTAMVTNPPNDPTWGTQQHHSIAWPLKILYRNNNKSDFVGFTMPLIDTRLFQSVDMYYDLKDRIEKIKVQFTWHHLLNTACNLTSAVAAIHYKGYCIGDLRETNILVAPNTLITLVDCDSFQIKDQPAGKNYYARVGIADYLPPELQGVDFRPRDYDRYYSDLFGLGILVFRLLMNGTHPFSAIGKPVENASTIQAKILKGYFSFSGRFYGVKPPDYAPGYDIIPVSLQNLFWRCFGEGHKDPTIRPTALEWNEALRTETKNIVKCKMNEEHRYFNHLSSCPWCKILHVKGIDYFPISSITSIIGQQTQLQSSLSVKISSIPVNQTQIPTKSNKRWPEKYKPVLIGTLIIVIAGIFFLTNKTNQQFIQKPMTERNTTITNQTTTGPKPVLQNRLVPNDTNTKKGTIIGEYGIICLTSYVSGKVYIDDKDFGEIESGEARKYEDQPVGTHTIKVKNDEVVIVEIVNVVKGKICPLCITSQPKVTSIPIKSSSIPMKKPTPTIEIPSPTLTNISTSESTSMVRWVYENSQINLVIIQNEKQEILFYMNNSKGSNWNDPCLSNPILDGEKIYFGIGFRSDIKSVKNINRKTSLGINLKCGYIYAYNIKNKNLDVIAYDIFERFLIWDPNNKALIGIGKWNDKYLTFIFKPNNGNLSWINYKLPLQINEIDSFNYQSEQCLIIIIDKNGESYEINNNIF